MLSETWNPEMNVNENVWNSEMKMDDDITTIWNF